MPAANAREKLTQASPYGRARCIDRLLRCTSSTLAREPHPTSTPAQPRRNPSSSYPLLLLQNPPATLFACTLCQRGRALAPVDCASIPDLTVL
ncbi:Uncharacterized protein DBV15_09368 [Temnothorax longispinosus]|uniref:Uncharacterized protein n=1 Tax=Temnothorax longispinosus TaxID=300112 RepID=A0A4S2KFL6_9HYME|nr:Uncharacterized protein DBV15_09368 [Temnothorax longispinosus]